MPYYYFDYDMSLSDYQFESGQIFAFRGFRDFHNAYESKSKVTNDYLVSFDMFGEKLWSIIHWKKEYPINMQNIQCIDQHITSIWKTNHRNTLDENMGIYSDMIKMFKRNIVVIPPLCKGCINEEELVYVEEKKKQFYMILQLFENVEVYDFCDEIDSLDKFYDYEHLNYYGRETFTELVNQIL